MHIAPIFFVTQQEVIHIHFEMERIAESLVWNELMEYLMRLE
jgi:hypothetical protein